MRMGEEERIAYHYMDDTGRRVEISLNDGGTPMVVLGLLNAVSILEASKELKLDRRL